MDGNGTIIWVATGDVLPKDSELWSPDYGMQVTLSLPLCATMYKVQKKFVPVDCDTSKAPYICEAV